MKKLSDTEAELKKALFIKKVCIKNRKEEKVLEIAFDKNLEQKTIFYKRHPLL